MSTAPSRPALVARSGFGPLARRDFRLFWAGACVSFVGSWVQTIAMGLLVYARTGSKQDLGIIGLAGGLPITLGMLFGGVIADRADKRRLVVAMQSLFALNAFALAALTWSDQIRIWHIVVLSCVNGLVFAVEGPARQAMVYDLVGREELAQGVALQSAAFNLARVVGPAVGGVLYVTMGPAWCFFVNGLSFAAIIVAILAIRTDLTRRGEAHGSVLSGLAEGLRHLRSNQMMRSVVALTAVTSVFAFSAYSTLMPALANDVLGIREGDPRYGLLFSAIGVGSLVGLVLVGRFAASERRGLLMVTCAHVFALVLLVLSRVSHPWLAMGLLMLVGLSAVAQLATANSLTQMLAPEAMRGRAVSTHMFAMGGLQPFGALLAGAVAQRLGVPAALALGACVLAAFAFGTLVRNPGVVRLR